MTASSFDFDKAIVKVIAGDAKNRREAVLPLRPDTAVMLKKLLSHKTPQTQVFNMPKRRKVATMLKADLRAAKINPDDNGQGKLDFHALRHTFGSMLAASGVHPKTAQELMRHSDINLTMSRYTHTLRGQTAKAVASLPDLSLPSKEAQKAKATGTNEIYLDTCLDTISMKNQNEPDRTGILRVNRVGTQNTTSMPKTPFSGSFGEIPEVGLEPTPCCQDGILNPARLPIPPLRLREQIR